MHRKQILATYFKLPVKHPFLKLPSETPSRVIFFKTSKWNTLTSYLTTWLSAASTGSASFATSTTLKKDLRSDGRVLHLRKSPGKNDWRAPRGWNIGWEDQSTEGIALNWFVSTLFPPHHETRRAKKGEVAHKSRDGFILPRRDHDLLHGHDLGLLRLHLAWKFRTS